MNRQRLLLVLLLSFAVSVIYSYSKYPRQKTVDKLTFTPGKVSRPAPAKADNKIDDSRILLALLDERRAVGVSYRKNLFRPLFRDETRIVPFPPPPPKPLPSLPPPPPPAAATVAPPAAAEPTPVQRDMARFTFLGFMKKDGKKTIFLSSNKEIFVVKKGDRITGKYEVANVTDDLLTINALGDGGQIIIPLIENKPLSAPRK
ncbi:hypothetical protein [Geobacter argillaceus]|uniref:Type II secretion system protein PulP n=1 Tax=Geobacter argillaceus TaxID=345631 RepID=A0A562VMY1_9BACT|nr:hypothetical protein [Geobacter argillaceus]TWJ19152.1 hypothetical protein JN12_02099 [Geobacter argillaceus]